MSKRRDFEYVVDIIDSMLDALEFLENLTEDQFYLDKKTQSAVIYKIQVIGEASKQISDALKQYIFLLLISSCKIDIGLFSNALMIQLLSFISSIVI